MKYFMAILFLVIVSHIKSYAQSSTEKEILFKGIIFDKETNASLAYVSIGLQNKPIGTISDSNGHYSFHVLQENLDDTVLISIVGYENKQILLKELRTHDSQNIFLTRKDYVLPAVVVSNRLNKTEIIGRQSSNKLVQISIHNKKSVKETIGSEMGIRVKPSHSGSYLKNVNWYFSANNFNYIKIRLNIYAVKNNMPDTLLSDAQIFTVIPDFKTGWISLDLLPYNVQVNQEFIITMQWIESRMDKEEPPKTIVPVSISNAKNTYARVASQDIWKRMKYSPSFYVTLVY
jgi:CarboxypepD_reg-like domain